AHRHGGAHQRPGAEAGAPQVMPDAAGDVRAADDVLAIEFEGRLHVGAPAWQAPLVLDGVAADLWHALARTGDAAAAAAAVAAAYAADVATVRADLEPFLGHLLARGALVRRA
ncbi:MAG: PqqD family peptide modification chaperone, partial [Trueperaceae bacterium]|nr:PqqD family peptide modification chaperone [Trueperaceae bacterium]